MIQVRPTDGYACSFVNPTNGSWWIIPSPTSSPGKGIRQELNNPPTAVGGIQMGLGPALRRQDLNPSTHSRGWDLDSLCKALVCGFSPQGVFASSTISAPSGIQRRTRSAAHIHCLRKEMHDGIATAEDGDSYADVQQRLFQS